MRSLQQPPTDAGNPPLGFLLNGGSVGSLLQSMDWRGSPVGPPHTWSPHLQTVMGTLLPAQAQCVLFWGPAYVALYNDAYAPSIGTKHPQALGRPAQENWSELWDDLEPLLRGVRESGQTFSAKDRPFYIERHGVGETAYFDVSYSAVREADGSVGGVLCLVTETTERVRFQQRQAFLLELGSGFAFVGRQRRLTLDGDHFYPDLVFYHVIHSHEAIVAFFIYRYKVLPVFDHSPAFFTSTSYEVPGKLRY